jgi:hypothetical protein
MNDLETAKNRLNQQNLTLTIVKNGAVLFETGSRRISGFLTAIEQLGTELKGASAADKVAGKAVALLCVYAGISQVYAEILSKKAETVLQQNQISYQYKQLVNTILNLNRTSVCPFEKTTEGISDPEKAYQSFKALQQSFKACK